MSANGSRALVLLAVAALTTTATSAAAQTYSRTAPDGTRYFTNAPTGPSYQRMGFTPGSKRISSLARTARAPRPAVDQSAYSREIAEAAARYAVPERLIWAVIQAESGFDPRAVSRKGARGLMQLMPETAAILGVRDAFDPRENINAGTRHLRGMMERFGQNLRLAVAAYNAGDKVVAAYRGVPPYPETQEYVTRVLRYYGAPVDWRLSPGSGIHQIVERDGTVVYTNVAPRRVSALLQDR